MDKAFSYFPGCSLHATAQEYDASTRATCALLDIGLRELNDWNCCGASSAHALDRGLATLLPARNLAIAAKAGQPLLIPCAACYGRSAAAQAALGEDESKRDAFADQFGFPYPGKVSLLSLLDVLSERQALSELRAKVRKPLTGLKTVCYYGCLLVRPPKVTGASNCEDPQSMDEVVSALGATAVPWAYKTDCCGSSLTLGRTDAVVKMVDRLLARAIEAGAEAIVTACPMCQGNLDMRQEEAAKAAGRQARLPIFYVSELAALALGHEKTGAWWKKHLVDPRPLLRGLGLV